MTCVQQRQKLLGLIDKAGADGARLKPACRQIGLSWRSVQRWQRFERCPGVSSAHRASGATYARQTSCPKKSARPGWQPSTAKRSRTWRRLGLPTAASMWPGESTMYPILRQQGQLGHRRPERTAQKRSRPRALAATGPDQVFCWDITYLPTQVRGQHFYLYLFEDLFSRKIIAWQVFDCQSAELAAQLLRDICTRHSICPRPADSALGQWRAHEGAKPCWPRCSAWAWLTRAAGRP